MRRGNGEQALTGLSEQVSELLDASVTVDSYEVETFTTYDNGAYAVDNVFTYDGGIAPSSRRAYQAVGDRYVKAVFKDVPSVAAVDRETAASYLAGIGVAIGSAGAPDAVNEHIDAIDDRRIGEAAAHAANFVAAYVSDHEHGVITSFADTARKLLGRDSPDRGVFGLTAKTQDGQPSEVQEILAAGIRTGFTTPDL